jgi:hypothetical protein
MIMTPTPETDSAYTQRPNEGAWDFKVRQEKTMESLERERNAAIWCHEKCFEDRKRIINQRDTLAEALNAILNDDPDSPLYKIKEARAALATLNQTEP